MGPDIGVSIIIPAFNEEETIEICIRKIKEALEDTEAYEIIVVDDASTDNTNSIVGGLSGVRLVKHPYNKGNGAAVKTGIMEARGGNIVIIDADGQHDPQHIKDMLKLLQKYDLVVGTRETFEFKRRVIANIFISKLATYISGIKIKDLTCGFRAFKKEIMLEFLSLLPNGFSLPSTSTLAFATSGYNIKFIPIQSRKRQGGTSSIKLINDGMKFLILILRMVSLFKPLKVFAPTSIVLFIMSLLWSVRTLSHSGQITPTVAMLFLSAVFTFLIGLLCDQIAEVRLSIGKINKQILKNQSKR